MAFKPALIVVDMQNDFCPPVGRQGEANLGHRTDELRMDLWQLREVETLLL
jgi:nicotinamidase-related amidase